MRLLDLFCGGGGASMGYARTGFEVVGVDIQRQPNYPFELVRGDAMEVLRDLPAGFDAIHASPPCQAYTAKYRDWGRKRTSEIDHPDLVGPVRELLEATGLPWVLENVRGSGIPAQLQLCGTMFGLPIQKHDLFAASWALPFPPAGCNHEAVYNPWKGEGRSVEKHRAALGIDWLPSGGGHSRAKGRTGDLYNATPPAYTEWIGRSLLVLLSDRRLGRSA